MQSSRLWQRKEGRLLFWNKCDETFQENHCSPDVAASFFVSLSEETNVPEEEKASLLEFAYKWLFKAEPKNFHALQDLLRKVWLHKIKAEMNFQKSQSVQSDLNLNLKERHRDHLEVWFWHVESFDAGDHCELVQELNLPFDEQQTTPLTDEGEQEALNSIINKLLDTGQVTQARLLVEQFGVRNQNLEIILSCIFLALGIQTESMLSESVRMYLARPKQPRHRRMSTTSLLSLDRSGSFIGSTASAVTAEDHVFNLNAVEDCLSVMEELAYHCSHGKSVCSRVQTSYRIAQTVGLLYESVAKETPMVVLSILLGSTFDTRYKLARSFVQAFDVDKAQIAAFLGEAIINSLRVIFMGESGIETVIFNASPRSNEITNVIKLCPDQSLLGYHLLDRVKVMASERKLTKATSEELNLETELLIQAHECFTASCNLEGISHVLKAARKTTKALVEAKKYQLMVHLVTGTGRFHEMSYIFDLLMKHHHFELLCRKGLDRENKLKVSLLEYLRSNHPEDTEKYSMVTYHFNMHREIADTLKTQAAEQSRLLVGVSIETNPSLQHKLQSISNLYCYAADNYAKEGCLRQSQECVRQARLIQLQIQLLPSNVRVINLRNEEVKRFLTKHTNFLEALLVADAYKLRSVTNWADAIYQHVVIKGDFKYFEDFKSVMPLYGSLYAEIASRFKAETTKSAGATSNMKKLLSNVKEACVKYRLASELSFTDISSSISEESYVRDIL